MSKSITLWDDCQSIPFSYGVHALQHNERMVARLFQYPRESFYQLVDYQHARRFAVPVSSDHSQLLWVNAPAFPRYGLGTKKAWLSALKIAEGGVLVVDLEDEKRAYKLLRLED